jgi:hypothetical protein
VEHIGQQFLNNGLPAQSVVAFQRFGRRQAQGGYPGRCEGNGGTNHQLDYRDEAGMARRFCRIRGEFCRGECRVIVRSGAKVVRIAPGFVACNRQVTSLLWAHSPLFQRNLHET